MLSNLNSRESITVFASLFVLIIWNFKKGVLVVLAPALNWIGSATKDCVL